MKKTLFSSLVPPIRTTKRRIDWGVRWLVDSQRSFLKHRERKHLAAAFKTFLARKVLRTPIVVRDRNGFQYIVHPEEPLFSLFYHGYLGRSEAVEQDFCKKVLKPGMTVLDVGANIGQFTLLFASLVGPSGRVFSFEPCGSTMRRLKTHIALNDVKNVTTEQTAAHHHHGSDVTLNVFPSEYSAWNTLGHPKMFHRDRPHETLQPVGQESVSTVAIDRFCQDRSIQQIDYLKVDVEGAELEVLMGCTDLLKQRAIKIIQFEISRPMIQGMGRDSDEVFKHLRSYGYTCHPMAEDGHLLPPVTATTTFFANFIATPATL